jgi:chaperonin GroEL
MAHNQSFTPKELLFEEDGRKKLISGVNKMAKAVKSTLGPRGKTVLIESPFHTHGITVTKDGVTVAKAVDLFDPVENLAVKIMKEAAERTATSAGDGTTTAIVLTEALIEAGLKHIKPEHNNIEVLRNMTDISNQVVELLKKKAKKVTPAMLEDVATISANNDQSTGKVIAETYNAVGKNGIVTVEHSQTSETYSTATDGLRVQRGYLSPYFINNHERDEYVADDIYILVCDAEISNILQIKEVLAPIANTQKKLLIIAPCTNQFINTLSANVAKGALNVCAIQPPSFGYKQHELMQDIALSVGATYYSEKTGDDLSLIQFSDLGHASKVIVKKDETIIVKDAEDETNAAVTERIEQLWKAHDQAQKKNDKDFILERIASLSGGIGVIHVGGNTDLEQKELYDRIDDAVCAVRSALEEGILPGGGKALYDINVLENLPLVGDSIEAAVAARIIQEALWAPLHQIYTNAGLDLSDYPVLKNDGKGVNIKTGEQGDLIKLGVIDPLKVTRSALQNAVSVAVTILSTNAIITEARSFEIK